MNRFFSHLKQPFTSIWVCIGLVMGCVVSVFYYQTVTFYIVTCAIILAGLYFKPFLTVLLGFICGILIVAIHYYSFYGYILPEHLINQPTNATMTVMSVHSQQSPFYIKARLDSIESVDHQTLLAPYAMLSVISTAQLKQGDRFQVLLKLKPYRSNKNFSVFDKQRFAFSQRILFKGRTTTTAQLLTSRQELSLRHTYHQYIYKTFNNTQLQWLYFALLTGDRSLMSDQQKQTLREFGLSHLLAISGLHIGLIFGLGFYVAKLTSFMFMGFVKQQYNINRVYLVCGFLCALSYVYLSDFVLSATRALIMLACYLVLYVFARQPLRWRTVLFALVCVLIINPFALLDPGLYFSFSAVVIIFCVFSRFNLVASSVYKKFIALCMIQVALFIGLLPLSVYFFAGVSVSGLLVNLLAVPLLGVIVMPLLVFITVVSGVFELTWLIHLFDYCLHIVYSALQFIPASVRWQNIPPFNIGHILICYSILFICYFCPYKRIAFLPFSALLIDVWSTPRAIWQLDVFDVGHGLMIMVSTQNQALIYDLGPSYFNKYSRVNSTLLPYIRRNNLIVQDTVVSHTDNDHAGGLKHWRQAGYGMTLKTFHPNGVHQGCEPLSHRLGNIQIESWPAEQIYSNSNDNSCVVKVSLGQFSALLTGDISVTREQQLIAKGYDLNSTILVSPHHGSRTSSSVEFIRAVSPELVLHSTAYQGQWLFPHAQVTARYDNEKVEQYTTAEQGHIRIEFFTDQYRIEFARQQETYWFEQD
ncbi:DNA internalization-related competence protein ComEC/Rec2 [Pseudoalteromonas mariniglutinosa]|uniref:DNA internalization-related competence protein ComEC/Rec2 n=1 Tax=Pseudoalteromonas mariniglutinosa TaxID=206042 RepID=UPI0038502864